MPDKSKKNKASKFRMMRPVEGQYFTGQPEGSVSTHISSVFESDGKYFVAPTITNKKAPYAGYQPQSFGEAYRAGEAIPFDSFDEAMFFSQNYKLPKHFDNMKKSKYDNGGKGSKTYLDSQRKRVTGSPIIPGMNFESDATMFGSPLLDPSYMQMMLDNQPGDQAPFDYRSIMNEDLYLDNVRKKPTTDFDAFLKAYRESGIDDRAYGGKADVDYEAEGGEVVIGNISVNKAYNGGMATKYKGASMYKLGGPSHADGGIGIKMNGDDPSYVFTDRLKVGGMKGATYADMASKFGNELDEISRMAVGGDVYDRNTSKRMSPRIMAEVKDLYDDQEAFKKEQGIDQETATAEEGGGFLKNVFGKLGAGIGMTPGATALQFLPSAFNVAKGLFGRQPEVDLGTYEPTLQDYQDFSPMEQRYMSQQNRALAGLRTGLEGSGATGSQLRAGLQSGTTASQQQAGQFYGQLGAMQMQDRARVDQANVAEINRAEQINQQIAAQEAQMGQALNPLNSLSKGLTQGLGTLSSMRREGTQRGMLKGMFGDDIFGAYGGQFGLRKKY
ncbi:MAG TPA: hypothetical protein DCX01_04440 [Bacteroidetes bacterium]|nr:hypothetical protein [Bacteroidota bacterium]